MRPYFTSAGAWIPIVSALSVGVIAAIIAIVLVFYPKDSLPPAVTNSETSLASEISQASQEETIEITSQLTSSKDDGLGRYGLEIVPGRPNFIKVSYPKNVFSFVGDTIVITLSDAYDETYVSLDQREFEVSPVPMGEGTFAIESKYLSENQFSITLLSAKNGEGTSLNLLFYDDWLYSLGFFYYREEAPVFIPSDIDHLFPITGGKVHCDLRSEVNLALKDTHSVSFQMNPFYNGQYVLFEEGIEPSYCSGAAQMAWCRFGSHNWPCTLAMNYIKIPDEIEVDEVMVLGWIKVADASGEYWYSLEPLTIHIIR